MTRVKALAWRKGYCDDQVEIEQASMNDLYQVRQFQGKVWLDLRQTATEHPTVEAAKAAAQADFNQRILSTLDPAEGDEPVAWRVKDYADGWWLVQTLEEAERFADNGNLIQPLFASPPPQEALTDAQVEAGARALAAWDLGYGDPPGVVKTVVDARWTEYVENSKRVLNAANAEQQANEAGRGT